MRSTRQWLPSLFPGCTTGFLLLFGGLVSVHGQLLPPSTLPQQQLIQSLMEQGVKTDEILDTDSRGVPVLCGTGPRSEMNFLRQSAPEAAALPTGTRGWEAIPCVIRKDGIETFRLEVNVNTNVETVTLECAPSYTPESGGTTQVLRDDGQGQDRVAGDKIWTSVRFRYNTNYSFSTAYFARDTNSPAGLDFANLGSVKIKEQSGVTNEFLIYPEVGLIDPLIPLTTARSLSGNVQVTPHLVNVQGTNQGAQKFMRYLSAYLEGVTKTMYSVVPDAFDFLVFFSSDHLEKAPRTTSANFNAGIHSTVKVSYTGTGMSTYDSSAWYGSQGRLQGVNVLDTASRGTYSGNATHELLHQWLVFTSSSLGLGDGTAHYNPRVGAASLLGGTQFLDSTNGGITINCEEGRSRAHYAPPLDRYMMGLIEATNVPPLRIYGTNVGLPFFICDQFIDASNLVRTVTIDEIVQAHGRRTPGPAAAQRDFSIGFIVESNARLLNPTELTFYEILAKHYTKPLPPSEPAPQLSGNWPPVTKFFGEGVTWRAYVREFVQPTINSVRRVEGAGIALSGTGFPKASYSLKASTNLVNWITLAEVLPNMEGNFQWTNAATLGSQFFRAVWNE